MPRGRWWRTSVIASFRSHPTKSACAIEPQKGTRLSTALHDTPLPRPDPFREAHGSSAEPSRTPEPRVPLPREATSINAPVTIAAVASNSACASPSFTTNAVRARRSRSTLTAFESRDPLSPESGVQTLCVRPLPEQLRKYLARQPRTTQDEPRAAGARSSTTAAKSTHLHGRFATNSSNRNMNAAKRGCQRITNWAGGAAAGVTGRGDNSLPNPETPGPGDQIH
jgi:hypothetical protein